MTKKRSRRSSRRRSRRRSKSPKYSIKVTHPGILTSQGYAVHSSAKTRHGALNRAIKKSGRNSVMRALNNLYVWNKNYHKSIAKIATSDKNWLRKNYPAKSSVRKSR